MCVCVCVRERERERERERNPLMRGCVEQIAPTRIQHGVLKRPAHREDSLETRLRRACDALATRFRCAAESLCKNMPTVIKTCDNLTSFERLKRFFRIAY